MKTDSQIIQKGGVFHRDKEVHTTAKRHGTRWKMWEIKI